MYMCRDLRSMEDTWDCNFLDTLSPLTSVERPLPLEHCLGRVGSGWSWHGWQSHLQTSPAGSLTSKPWRSDVRECQRMSETAFVDATSLDKQRDTDGHMDFHQNWCWGVASPGLLQSTGQDWRYRHYTHGNSFKRYMRTTKLSVSWCHWAVSGPVPQANAKITMAFASLTDPRFDSSNSVRDSAPNTARWPYSSTHDRCGLCKDEKCRTWHRNIAVQKLCPDCFVHP